MRIAARFNGPPDSGNGGYTCGLLAASLGAHAAEIALRAPVPLERELEAVRDGERLVVRDGETLVAEGVSIAEELPAPPPTDLATARTVARAGRERWAEGHPFPTCFACGPDRSEGDGLRIFPVPLGNGRFAADWTPAGDVPPEQMWAALDCPTSAPAMNADKDPPIVLGRLAASIRGTVTPGEPHLLLSWELAREGRKRHSACALFDAGGSELARSRALWIELRPRR